MIKQLLILYPFLRLQTCCRGFSTKKSFIVDKVSVWCIVNKCGVCLSSWHFVNTCCLLACLHTQGRTKRPLLGTFLSIAKTCPVPPKENDCKQNPGWKQLSGLKICVCACLFHFQLATSLKLQCLYQRRPDEQLCFLHAVKASSFSLPVAFRLSFPRKNSILLSIHLLCSTLFSESFSPSPYIPQPPTRNAYTPTVRTGTGLFAKRLRLEF